MKIKTFLVLIICGGLAFSSSPQLVENGIKVAGKNWTLVLTEDLVIAPDDERDETIWPGFASSVVADDKGHMFVADTQENRVVEFDAKGVFVKYIGQKGGGPGEFQALKSFQVLADGTAIAFENLQIASGFNYFDREMKFVEKKNHQSMEKIITTAIFSPDGQYAYSIAAAVLMEERQIATKFVVLDRDLKIVKEILRFDASMPDQSRMGDADYWAEFLADRLKNTSKGLIGFAAFDEKGNIYTAKAGSYEIQKWNQKFEPIYNMTKKYKPIPMTEEEIDSIVEPIQEAIRGSMPPQIQQLITKQTIRKAVDLAEFPPIKNPIGGLKVLPSGELLVIHDPSLLTNVTLVDIFSPEGVFLGSFKHDTLGVIRMAFKGDYAYTLEVRDDENHLVRYKMSLEEVH